MAQAEVVVAATEKKELEVSPGASMQLMGQAILAAALSMPCLESAHAETVPEFGLISYKYLDYRENQVGEDRIKVKADSLSVMLPFAGKWSVQAGYTHDAVSGASPRLWTKGAASMRDKREAVNLSVTRYFEHDTFTVGANYSDENDYKSQGLALLGTHSSEDKNTTFNYGVGLTRDHITSLGLDESKRKTDWVLGVTQVLTPKDIIQLTLTDAAGRGYFSDPYKVSDQRPESRYQNTLLFRWNHFISATDATLRFSYRYYTDSWQVKAHTLGLEYVQPIGDGWVFTPAVRVHDQSAAEFYLNPADFPSSAHYKSLDQRLSAFGARTFGLKIAKTFDSTWTVDIKYEQYMQRTDWRFMGEGSPGLDPFTARIFQFGLSRRF